MKEIKPYKPSNGTEGLIFMERFCDKCAHNESSVFSASCPILAAAVGLDIDDQNYPNQWRYVGDDPVCIAFRDEE